MFIYILNILLQKLLYRTLNSNSLSGPIPDALGTLINLEKL